MVGELSEGGMNLNSSCPVNRERTAWPRKVEWKWVTWDIGKSSVIISFMTMNRLLPWKWANLRFVPLTCKAAQFSWTPPVLSWKRFQLIRSIIVIMKRCDSFKICLEWRKSDLHFQLPTRLQKGVVPWAKRGNIEYTYAICDDKQSLFIIPEERSDFGELTFRGLVEMEEQNESVSVVITECLPETISRYRQA